MTGTTSIEWCTATWNPLVGCTRVSAECDHCYACTLHDMRYAAYQRCSGLYQKNGKPMPKQYAKPFSEIQLLPQRLEDPLHVKKPQLFFVNSMADLFHSQVPDDYIFQVFESMRQADWHIFQVLTKRPGRLRRLGQHIAWPANVWMGVSVGLDQFAPRVDALREVPAAVRFLSLEPLLGPLPSLNLEYIDWTIAGGESGPDAHPCDPVWVRDIRDRCCAEQVAFFFKQWGGRTSKAGGRLLDGVTWDQMPSAYELWKGHRS